MKKLRITFSLQAYRLALFILISIHQTRPIIEPAIHIPISRLCWLYYRSCLGVEIRNESQASIERLPVNEVLIIDRVHIIGKDIE